MCFFQKSGLSGVINGRIREEKRAFFAFCAVLGRQVMILPYINIGSSSEHVL